MSTFFFLGLAMESYAILMITLFSCAILQRENSNSCPLLPLKQIQIPSFTYLELALVSAQQI
ncbi:hypothetical protein, partial [Mycobacterium tuberculosis]